MLHVLLGAEIPYARLEGFDTGTSLWRYTAQNHERGSGTSAPEIEMFVLSIKLIHAVASLMHTIALSTIQKLRVADRKRETLMVTLGVTLCGTRTPQQDLHKGSIAIQTP